MLDHRAIGKAGRVGRDDQSSYFMNQDRPPSRARVFVLLFLGLTEFDFSQMNQHFCRLGGGRRQRDLDLPPAQRGMSVGATALPSLAQGRIVSQPGCEGATRYMKR